ncbi:hypothetical protein D3C72_1599430 [compost metagenome]
MNGREQVRVRRVGARVPHIGFDNGIEGRQFARAADAAALDVLEEQVEHFEDAVVDVLEVVVEGAARQPGLREDDFYRGILRGIILEATRRDRHEYIAGTLALRQRPIQGLAPQHLLESQ